MKTFIGVICLLLTLGAIASIGAWTFFNFVWWVPTSGAFDARREMISMLHFFCLISFPTYLAVRKLDSM